MKNRFAELYSKLPTGVRNAIDEEDAARQMDRDASGDPYIISCEPVSEGDPVYKVELLRDGFIEFVQINSRKRKNAIIRRSYNTEDGWLRPEIKRQRVQMDTEKKPSPEEKRKERSFREGKIDYEKLLTKLIG
jgi:hypothetical protein